jgi:hypothetical protein
MTIPTDSSEFGLFALILLPGLVYQTVRSWVSGERLGLGDVALRTLQAVVVGSLLSTVYFLIASNPLSSIVAEPESSLPATAAWMLLGAFVIPAILALALHGRKTIRISRRKPWIRLSTPFRSTPTAWDHAAPRRGGVWVRIRLASGDWVGGWMGHDAYVSTFPMKRDIYISNQCHMGKDGTFERLVGHGLGLWVEVPEGAIVEWIADGSGEVGEQANVN